MAARVWGAMSEQAPPRPTILTPIRENIPNEMKQRGQWLCWRLEFRNGRWTKVPVDPKSGGLAKTNNPKTWASFDSAWDFYHTRTGRGVDGIGFVFCEDDTFVGIDLDHCITDGILDDLFTELAETFVETYIETSVSGTGLHIIAKANAPFQGAKCKNGDIEMFSNRCFFTITGRYYSGSHQTAIIAGLQAEVDEVYRVHFSNSEHEVKLTVNVASIATPMVKSHSESGHESLLATMFSAKNGSMIERLFKGDASGYPSVSEADLALCNHFAFYTSNDQGKMDTLFRASGLFRADKWDRNAGGGESYGQKTIQVAIDGTHAAYGELPQTASRKPPMLTRDAIISRINAVEDPQGTGLEVLSVDILTDVANSDLPLSHVEQILKQIARTSKLPVTALRNDLKIMRKQLEIDGDDVRHDKVAISVIASFGDGNVIYTQSTFWVWDGRGKWRKIDDRIIKKRIHDVSKPLNLTKSVVDSIADLCKTEMFTEVHAFDQQREMINCINGELHYADGTYQLRPHCREHYATTQIPITFDQTAVAHRFERFLDEVFEFDDDKEMKKVLLLEALGYSLLATCQYEKFFMLIGQGANGKSVILYVLAAMVGRDHVAAVQPSQFSNKFQRGHLQGKLANLISELAANEVLADAEMKAIASGELMTAEHKFKAPFEFNVYATCWFATNYLPQTRDRSDALLRRAIILPFNRVFKEHEQDRHLKNALIDELPGILNLALKALAGVHARGAFTCAPSVELTKERWRSTTNHVPDFVEDCCELLTECSVESGKLYSAYKSWCSARSISLIGQQQLTLQLQRLGIALRKGTNGARLLQGIGLILDTAAGSNNNESSTGGGGEGREGTGGAGGVGGAPSRHNPQDVQHELFPGATGINVPEE